LAWVSIFASKYTLDCLASCPYSNPHRKTGVEVVAICVVLTAESQKLCQSRGYSFPFLSHPNAQVMRQYGVLHPKGGEDGKDIARAHALPGRPIGEQLPDAP
jgi:hypothetical protein